MFSSTSSIVFYPSDAVDTEYIEWDTQNDNIARVSSSRNVTGVKRGSTWISATVGNHNSSVYVEVLSAQAEVERVEVSDRSITLQSYGDSVYVDARILPTNATEQRLLGILPDDPFTTTPYPNIKPSIDATVDRSAVAENDFVEITFDVTTPDYHSEIWIAYAP